MQFSASTGFVIAYDRNNTVYKKLGLRGDVVEINAALGGSTRKMIDVSYNTVIINEDSNDIDFRVESNGETHMLYVDGGGNKVGIGQSAPKATLDIDGSLNIDGSLYFRSVLFTPAGAGGNVSNTGTPVNNQLAIWTNATTIEGDGDLTYDGTAFDVSAYLRGPNASNTTPSYSFRNFTSSGMYVATGPVLNYSVGGTLRFSMNNSGVFKATGDIIAYSTSVSDIRLKKNIKKINGEESLSILKKFNGIEYKLKKNNQPHSGLIAQEVEKILPHIVVEDTLLDEDSTMLYKTIRYSEIIPYLIEGMKQQQLQIEKQQKEIEELKLLIK